MNDHHRVAHTLRSLSLLLGVGAGCTGDVSLGGYGDSDGATSTASGTEGTDATDGTAEDTGTDSDTDAQCTEDCDPEFAISMLHGENAEGREIVRSGFTLCDDENCPDAFEASDPCLTDELAAASPLGVEEFCRYDAGRLIDRLSLEFATPVQRSSFEKTRPGQAGLEPYWWHTGVVELLGPGTRYRGDAVPNGGPIHNSQRQQRYDSVVNEACAQQLTAQGVAWDEASLESLCEVTTTDAGISRPLRMEPSMVFSPTEGRLSGLSGSCDAPGEGADTCCSACDYAMGPAVARYGVDDSGAPRTQAGGTAIPCDSLADPLSECRDLRLAVERPEGDAYVYTWGGSEMSWPLPRADKLRETHPDDRPEGLERPGRSCSHDGSCDDGMRCYGTRPNGDTCSEGDDCEDRTCRLAWFGTCGEVENGDRYCVDRRFDSARASACYAHADDPSQRLAECHPAFASPQADCCDEALGGGPGCDPFEQSGLDRIPRHDRAASGDSDACVCESGQPESCDATLQQWCAPPIGTGSEEGYVGPEGAYAAPKLARFGGVQWDSELQQVRLNFANYGDLGRAHTEVCSEPWLSDRRSAADGWIANANILSERRADNDLALCSGSTYTLRFAESTGPEHLRSEGQGTLDGRSTFTLETAQFRTKAVLPPETGVRRSCEAVAISLTNQFDIGPSNLRKVELHEGTADGPLVAGGLDCSPDGDDPSAVPCLSTGGDRRTTLWVQVDEDEHGPVLTAGQRYVVVFPGLADIGQMTDAQAYAAAFHDACGMPLIDAPEGVPELGFEIDEACG